MRQEDRMNALISYLNRIQYNMDYAEYNEDEIILCKIPYYYPDLITISNYQTWENANLGTTNDYRKISIFPEDINCMSFDDISTIMRYCKELTEYPILDEFLYSDLENDAFAAAFKEEFCYEDGNLKPRFRRYGRDRLRDMAWQLGGVEGDYFYIPVGRVIDACRKEIKIA